MQIKIKQQYIKRRLFPLLLTMLFLCGFMGYQGIDTSNIKYVALYACFATVSIYLGTRHVKRFSSLYDLSIIAFILVILFSFIPGMLWGGQSVYYSLRGVLSWLYCPIFLYVFLQGGSYKKKDVLYCLGFLFFVYVILFFYSWLIYPDISFNMGSVDEDRISSDLENRGTLRLMLPFEDTATLGILYFINNPLKNRRHNIITIVALLVLILMRGTRSIVAGTILIAGMLYLKRMSWLRTKSSKILNVIPAFAVGLCLISVCKFTGVSNVLESYVDVSSTDFEAGGDYIRWVMAAFYLFQYNTSAGEYVFGHGIPVSGHFYQDVATYKDFGLYPDDVGYIEIFVNFGLLGILALVWILISVITRKVSPKCYYAKYYIYYIFLISFFGRYFLTSIIIFVAMLYVIRRSGLQDNKYNGSERIDTIGT